MLFFLLPFSLILGTGKITVLADTADEKFIIDDLETSNKYFTNMSDEELNSYIEEMRESIENGIRLKSQSNGPVNKRGWRPLKLHVIMGIRVRLLSLNIP